VITQDRNGNNLPQLDVDTGSMQWSARLVYTAGSMTSTTNWVFYELPPEAIVSRQRAGQLDGLTWTLSLEVLANALPETTEPLSYYQLQIDLVDDDGNRWPYFTGIVDSIAETQALQDGGIVQTLTLECYGVMQLAKRYEPTFWSRFGPTASLTGNLSGYVVRRYATVATTAVVGWTGSVPGAWHSLDATVAASIQVASTDSFSVLYVYGVDYTVTTTDGQQLALTFPGPVAPAATIYVRWLEPQFFAIPYSSSVTSAWLVIPDGKTYWYDTPRRSITDTFQTYAAAGCTSSVITVQDPEPYKSGAAVVAQAAPFSTDYLAWTKTDGTEEVRAIASTDAAGVITLSVAFTAAPANGDPIRVVTAETKRQWTPGNGTSGTSQGSRIRLFTSGGVEYSRTSFQVVQGIGRAVPVQGRHYLTAERVQATVSDPIRYFTEDLTAALGSNARIESAFYNLLNNVIVPAGRVYVGTPTGGTYGGFIMPNKALADVVAELTKQAMPGNAFLHDEPDGRISISAYSQAAVPVATLDGILQADLEALPEPVTQVVVLAKGPERNVASLSGPILSTGWTNPERLFDGSKNSTATCTSGSTVTFQLAVSPSSVGNRLFTDIRVSGSVGLLTVRVVRLSANIGGTSSGGFVRGGYWTLNDREDTVIPWSEIAQLAAGGYGYGQPYDNAWLRVELTFYSDDSSGVAVAPVVSEITLNTDVSAAWAAALSSDTSGTPPTGWSTLATDKQVGSVWWQRSTLNRGSFKYASDRLLRRILPSYSASWSSVAHRQTVLELDSISADECRDFAELYLDEAWRPQGRYRLTGVLDPRISLGDTVAVTDGTGEPRILMVWAISDGGAGTDLTATWELVDYS